MLIIMMKVKIIYFLSSYLWMILLVMVSMLRTIGESMLIGVCLLRIENKAGVMVGESMFDDWVVEMMRMGRALWLKSKGSCRRMMLSIKIELLSYFLFL